MKEFKYVVYFINRSSAKQTFTLSRLSEAVGCNSRNYYDTTIVIGQSSDTLFTFINTTLDLSDPYNQSSTSPTNMIVGWSEWPADSEYTIDFEPKPTTYPYWSFTFIVGPQDTVKIITDDRPPCQEKSTDLMVKMNNKTGDTLFIKYSGVNYWWGAMGTSNQMYPRCWYLPTGMIDTLVENSKKVSEIKAALLKIEGFSSSYNTINNSPDGFVPITLFDYDADPNKTYIDAEITAVHKDSVRILQ